jgi:hypothetical protein
VKYSDYRRLTFQNHTTCSWRRSRQASGST